MRRLNLIAATVGIFLALGGVEVVAFVYANDCTLRGTDGRDFLSGSRRSDIICSGPGRDFISGEGNRDTLRGGPGEDTIVGGGGRDRLRGGRGDDRLFSVDGVRDVLWGGRGFDRCFGDALDFIRCEKVRRSKPETTTMALSASLSDSIGVAAEETIRPPCNEVPGCGADQT